MTSAVQLLRDQVAKELQGSVTIIGKKSDTFIPLSLARLNQSNIAIH